MSPAAVEVRSPIAPRQNPSSAQPPETNPSFGGLHAGGGFAGDSVSRRPRPRLVKVRRQVGYQDPRARSETAGSGFNALRSSAGFGSGNVGGGNGGFVFGADRSGVGEGSVKVGNVGFVFGAKENNQESNIGVEEEKFIAKEVVFDAKTESELLPGKFGFGSGSDSNPAKAKGGEFAEKPTCDDVEKTELGNEAERFAFGANQSGSVSNSNLGNCCSGANVKTGHETEVRKSSCSEFKFSARWFNSESNLNSEKRDAGEKVEDAVKLDTTRSSNSDNGARTFAFRSSSQASSGSDEPATAKCQDEVKLNRGNLGNSDNNSGPGLSFSFNDIHENGDCSASVSSANSAFKLPDEIRKLNINESVNVSGAEKTYSFSTKLFSNAGIASTTRKYRKGSRGLHKVSNCSSRNIETNFCDESSNGHSFDTEKINVNISGSSCRNCVSATSGTEPFTFRAGLSESDQIDQVQKGQGLDNKEPNVASSKHQECQPSVSEPAFFGEEKDTRSSPITPDKLGVPSTDFGRPLCDPSSLKESLFPELDKKLEFSLKNRPIKGKRFREMKRKSQKPQVKQCHGQADSPKESSFQEDPNTPGCYSPMDFSPYQESTVTDQFPKETSVESAAELRSEMRNQEKSQMQFHDSSRLDDKTNSFMFSAASPEQGKLSARKHRFRRKSRVGVGHDSFVINPSTDVKSESSSMQCSPHSQSRVDKSEAGPQVKGQGSSSEVHETCENWRLRGNQAYKSGDLSKAEEFYTQGIVSVPSNERSGSCLEPLLLCYSNRAAARMRLQRVREAIGDCITAAALDPSFIKAHLRAANCHLALGEIEHALQYFSTCMEIGAGVFLDRRIILDAADGQQKAQKVAQCINQSATLLEGKSLDAALNALEIISEALSTCLYSEKLLKMKAEALIVLRRHDEAIQLCEKSLTFAEKNFNSAKDIDGSASGRYSLVRLWRWFLISKSYFHLGRLEAALPLLDKLKEVGSINDESVRKDIESSTSLAATIRNLLHHKNAGNEAFKSGRYSEAVDHYTLALSSNVESRRFAAICFCNRAAAHQALGQIVDAIADCSLAIALDGNYVKAISRRAVLHEMIRDYGQAASDLQKLISILDIQPSDKAKESGTSGRSAGSVKDLRQAQTHLLIMEEEAKIGISLNFYLILGSKQSDTSADIKKAYRKAALKHHPDKAGQFLARSESGDEGRLWKEISQEVHKDADRLFKMIGEAYAVLSDPSKRSQHDLDEELRKASKANSGSSPAQRRNSDAHTSTSRSSNYGRPDFQSSPFERSSYKRNFRDNWKTYGNSYSRWYQTNQ